MAKRSSKPRRAVLALFALVLIAPLAPAGAMPGETYRASIGRNGAQPNGPTPATSVNDTTSPQLSLDGLRMVFSSDASNLVTGDTNRVADVFLYDITTRTTARVSVASNESQANGASHSPAISVDGRYVAFVSEASNLVAGDTNGVADIFLRDRKRGTTVRVSVKTDGRQVSGASRNPQISLFGRYVVFESEGVFTSSDTNGLSDAIIRDVERRRTATIRPPADPPSRKLPNGQGDPSEALLVKTWTSSPSISYDGRFVAYTRGTFERAPAMPSSLDVMIFDRVERRHHKITLAPWMGAAKQMLDNPRISADGRYVAFEAWSVLDNAAGSDEALIPNPLDPKDVFLYDQISRGIGQVSVNSFSQPGNGASYAPSISAGGQFIAFTSEASNLVAGDTNGSPDAFVRDNVLRTTARMSLTAAHAQSSGGGTRPTISYEGRRVTFASEGRLGGGDSDAASDVYWRDRRTDVRNEAPSFRALRAPRTINPLEETSFGLRARDPDGDPVRYGTLLVKPPRTTNLLGPDGLPPGASVAPSGGTVRWTPNPDQAGTWTFIFWVDDPNGLGDFQAWEVMVRTVDQLLNCKASGAC